MNANGERVVKAQQSVINKMKEDNEALKHRLARESRFTRLSQNMSTSGDIVKLQEEANRYLRRIESERRKINQLDTDIADAQATIIEQRKKMGGINASKENHDMISRQIRIYENRLDKSLLKFNESLAKNKSLRDRIDDLRRERVVFDGIYKKLERELDDKKKEMAAIIEDSKNAYAVRDKTHSEMVALKAQAEQDQLEFEREWEELGKIMEQDRLLRESMKKQEIEEKANDVDHDDNERAREAENEQSKSEESFEWSADKPGSQSALSFEKVQMYEEAFQKIKESTGIKDIHELVDKFLQAEDKNFRLFNFVNSLNSEIERLEVMIADTKVEIEKYKGQGVSTDTQRKKVLRDLEDRLSKTETRAEEYESKYANANKVISQLKQGIQSIFTRLGPSRRGDSVNNSSVDERASMEEVLGNQGVTESNMMQYLGIIEQRTSEILELYYMSQASASGKEVRPQSFIEEGTMQPSAPRLSVLPPSWEDFSSGEESDHEDDERPLTRDELQRKTTRGLGRRETRHKAKNFGK